MDRNRGNPILRRHLDLLKDVDETTPRSLRDVLGGDDYEGRLVDRLVRLVGGIDALEVLAADPLPLTEPFDFGATNAAEVPTIRAVLAALHEYRPRYFDAVSRLGCAYLPQWLQGEYVTIVHRLIGRAASGDLSHWRRHPQRIAAAFVWLALGGNCAMGRSHPTTAQDIWNWYDVSDCRALARRLCVDAQLGSLYVPDDEPMPLRDLQVVLGDVEVLHSSFRTRLVRQRADLERWIVETDRRRSSQRPMRLTGDGQVELKGRQIQPMWAYKGTSYAGRASVMVALGRGPDDDDYELVGLTVPDARELMAMLQQALDAPAPGTMRGVQSDRTLP